MINIRWVTLRGYPDLTSSVLIFQVPGPQISNLKKKLRLQLLPFPPPKSRKYYSIAYNAQGPGHWSFLVIPETLQNTLVNPLISFNLFPDFSNFPLL